MFSAVSWICFAEACESCNRVDFVVDYPADQAALARLRPDNPSVAARFELVIDGVKSPTAIQNF